MGKLSIHRQLAKANSWKKKMVAAGSALVASAFISASAFAEGVPLATHLENLAGEVTTGMSGLLVLLVAFFTLAIGFGVLFAGYRLIRRGIASVA